MTTEQMIKMALTYKGMKQAELARRFGITPSNFNQQLKRNSFTKSDLEQIAEILECEFVCSFVFPDGMRIEGAK